MMRPLATPLAAASSLLALLAGTGEAWREPPVQPPPRPDGHTRPRDVVFSSGDGLLFVALSTADAVVVVDPGAPGGAGPPRVVARVATGRFPQALAALPKGGVLVSCRFDPALGVVERAGDGRFRYRTIPAGAEHGHRGLAVDAAGRFAYVASPPSAGVKVVALDGGGVVQTLATGLSPHTLHLVDDPGGGGARLLLVANFVEHTVTVHRVARDGRLGAALQVIETEAPVQDMALAGHALLLATHEDRPIDRAHLSVEGLDSVVLSLPLAPPRAGSQDGPIFDDPGPGRRRAFNLTERAGDPVVKLEALRVDAASGRVVIAGSASDNVFVASAAAALAGGRTATVGGSPVALAFLPDGRIAAADRLSDTLSLVDPTGAVTAVDVGRAERPSPAERGELLFYGRALVPNNVATGPLSIYACSACHDDGHVDGRLHPAKRNRFRSMTKTCRGIATTAPYLSLGEVETLPDFADNIVATHAQGAEADPDHYDRYPVTLRLRAAGRWTRATLSADQVRAALTAYMAVIPLEPSPFVAPGATVLPPAARRGLAVFRERCAGCHLTVGNTSLRNDLDDADAEARLLRGEITLAGRGLYDVGTPVLGKGGNNPPSLRGVWEAAPYFSDGSARSLDEVLLRTNPEAERVHAPGNARGTPALAAADRAALLAFLRCL